MEYIKCENCPSLTNEQSAESLPKQASKQVGYCAQVHGGKDEWFTPREAVEVILPYIKGKSHILCPFDTEDSEFVKVFSEHGFNVEYSHINTGTDFFRLDKPDVEYVISNPPFSKRDLILQRLYEWDIPFAMIFNAHGLFDSKFRIGLAMKYGAEILYIYPRVKFTDMDGTKTAPPFQSCYLCHKVLPNDLCFEFMES